MSCAGVSLHDQRTSKVSMGLGSLIFVVTTLTPDHQLLLCREKYKCFLLIQPGPIACACDAAILKIPFFTERSANNLSLVILIIVYARTSGEGYRWGPQDLQALLRRW